MNNPFDLLDTRLNNIELLLLELTQGTPKSKNISSEIPQIFGMDICTQITGFAKPTIYKNTSKNLIPHFKRDGKIFFKRDEIYAWMTENRVKTQSESIQDMDDRFVNKRQNRK